jgi:hypothetical protein
MGGLRARQLVAVTAIALVAVNLLVFLYIGPSMSTLDPVDDNLPKDGGGEPELNDDPVVTEDVEGEPPGNEPKG